MGDRKSASGEVCSCMDQSDDTQRDTLVAIPRFHPQATIVHHVLLLLERECNICMYKW